MMELQRCIYYHASKTGGYWVKNALRQTCKVVKELNTHCNKGYYDSPTKPSFSFVRNPASLYESTYQHYRRKDCDFIIDYKFWVFPKYAHLPFPEFVEAMVENEPGWLTDYSELFLAGIDYIGRYENLQEDLFEILDVVGEPHDKEVIRNTPPANVGKYHNRVEMTPYLRGLIEKSERGLIEKFYT